MTRKKLNGKDQKIGIKLSIEERKLILGDPIRIHQEIADHIRATAMGAPVLLTLDDLEDLGGYIAAEANHTTDKKLRKKLDVIFSKIQDLLETHADEEPPKSLKTKGEKRIADRTVQLAEWAATMLIGAERLGIKDKVVARFPLLWVERAVLLMFTTIDKKTLKKFEAEKPIFRVGEIGRLLIAVATALLEAPPLQCNALLMIAKSLIGCLEAEVRDH
jgi:hypothetical protein